MGLAQGEDRGQGPAAAGAPGPGICSLGGCPLALVGIRLLLTTRGVCVCVCVCVYMRVCVFSHSVVSSLCNPMDCSLPGSSVHGILQARILEQVAISYSKRYS